MQDIPPIASVSSPTPPDDVHDTFSIVERQRTDMLANTISKVARLAQALPGRTYPPSPYLTRLL